MFLKAKKWGHIGIFCHKFTLNAVTRTVKILGQLNYRIIERSKEILNLPAMGCSFQDEITNCKP